MTHAIARRHSLLASMTLSLAAVLALTACGSSSSGGGQDQGSSASTGMSSSMSGMGHSGATASSGSTVEIKNFTFAPMSLTVPVGTTVTWKFDDAAKHTVKATDGSFTSPALSAGTTFTHKFTHAGTFSYICSIHQYMTGTIVVQ